MELGALCCSLPSQPLQFSNRRIISVSSNPQAPGTRTTFGFQTPSLSFACASKCLKWVDTRPSISLMHASDSNVFVTSDDVVELVSGKSGSCSFHGMTYPSVEGGKLKNASFEKKDNSFFWLLAPAAFISCLILPRFFLRDVVEAFIKDPRLVDIVSSLFSEILFYIGFATFLLVADNVQNPYLEFSSKRWGLITGLKGYLYSAIFTTGLKIIVPVLLLYMTWSVVSLEAIVTIGPFLVGCVAQFAFETYLNQRESSCWPIVPIIFEVYRMYQVSKAANFAEILLFAMRELPSTPAMKERSGALFAIMVTFQLLGMVCLWSLMTFLVRLFPSRPVADNY
ncbi:hypothetical protein HN51_020825 [Arachis hypogaea]|uniref:Uncharacterized protein n=2 Tax=Arachis TaxID=3817 RepID=A0A445EJ33_ARAHY|nr:uncharacterized protein LOC112708268 [Arachis hypogaea]XP_057743628.1 uncharacterized protein LOC130961665 [Arachis stenosperma]QHO52033.1 uncharacterized protein DS421_2g36090 [Arachis hypogaea]RYR75460.1 hypothetical protein Ahy_A02g010098 [Arachis hypogaea]